MFSDLGEQLVLLAAVFTGIIATVMLVVHLEDRLQGNYEPGRLTRRVRAWWHGA